MMESREQRLGNYSLSRLLGRGGFADVYYGEHIYLKTPAAIKMLHIHITSNEQEKFLAEARIAAQLENPYIISVLEFGIERDIPYLVMDYAAHGTLRQRYPKATRLVPAQIAPYVKQVATALQYTHDQRLVHRDIKPENMLLSSNDAVLLSDFGIALVVQHAQGSENEQKVVGTIAYMAPEQLRGEPCPASDQYALGAVIYEWLSGYPPFYGSFTEVAVQHALVPPIPLRKRVPQLLADVEEVVMIALAKEPGSRFKSMKAFASAFAQACSEIQSLQRMSPTHDGVQETNIATPSISAQPEEPPLSPVVRKQLPRRALIIGTIGGAGLLAGGALAWKPLSHELQSLVSPAQPPAESLKKVSALPPPSGPGATLYTYHGHAYINGGIAWMPNSTRIVSAGTSVQIWDAITGEHGLIIRVGSYLAPIYTGSINAMALSPDGKYIVAGVTTGQGLSGGGNAEIRVWTTSTGQSIYHSAQTSQTSAVAWSPDGTLIASCDSATNTIQIWEALTGKQHITYKGHTSLVNAIAWSPDGTYIASTNSANYDPNPGTVHVWDIATAHTHLIYHGHSDTVNAVAWSPNSQFIASSGGRSYSTGPANPNDHTAQIWSPDSDKPLLIYHSHAGAVNTVAWSPDGKFIVSGSTAANAQDTALAQIWNSTTGKLILTYDGHTHAGYSSVSAVAWSPNGALIASAAYDGTIQVWKANS